MGANLKSIFPCKYSHKNTMLIKISNLWGVFGTSGINKINILVPQVASVWYLTLILLVSNLANTKWCKNPEKLLKPWEMGTHLRVLSQNYPMNINMTGFRCFSKIFESLCFGRKYPGENKHVKTCFKHVLTCLKKHVFLGITCFNINVKWPTNIIL